MSRISRTRSAAAGIEAPATSTSLHNEPLGNAAAAAKSRHNDLRQHQQEAKPAQQPQIMPADSTEQHSTDMPQVTDLAHEGIKDENMLASQSEAAKAQDRQIPIASGDSLPVPSDTRAARTRSLPPKPTTARTRSAKAPPAKPAQTAAPAEHAVPAAPSANHLSSTLAGIAQSLVTFSNNLHAAPAHTSDPVPEQIDMDLDFTNDSQDSDFQPEQEFEADDDVIDLSQEDPVDVVEHGDGSIAIRSPLQAAAVAAVEAGVGDDDEEEFQQLQGKGKRKTAGKDATGGMSHHSLGFLHPCLLAGLPACLPACLWLIQLSSSIIMPTFVV